MSGSGNSDLSEGKLCAYLVKHGVVGGDDAVSGLEAEKCSHGQSNPTYILTLKPSQQRLVLRRKPFGSLLPKAHQIDREFMLLERLRECHFPVPRVHHYCKDTSVIGAEFYIMEFVDGTIFRDPSLPDLTPKQRHKVYYELATVLKQLHSLSLNALELPSSFVKHNFFQRQLHVWTKQYELASQLAPRNATFAQLAEQLEHHAKHIGEQELVLCHGDFRLDNVVFHPEKLTVMAVLDWELASTGPPVADLAYACLQYHMPAQEIMGVALPGLQGIQCDGVPDERTFLRTYGVESRPHAWGAFVGLSALRLSSIAQGVYARSLQGNASATNAADCKAIAVALADVGLKAVAVPRDVSLFPLSERTAHLLASLHVFMESHVYPSERKWEAEVLASKDPWAVESSPVLEALKTEAKRRGLWNLFLPAVSGMTQLEYARFAEVMGRSLLASEACNCNAPDTGNMEVLHMYGTKAQKDRWLAPLLEGRIRSCFCMTEPDVASSDATNMQCTITRAPSGDGYVVTGRKWWSTGAGSPRCKFAIVMGRTPDTSRPKHQQHSMIIVPLDAKGVRRVRPLTTFGYDDRPAGHFEMEFDHVLVPRDNMILGEGRGFEIAQGRLGPGRLHHCMRAVGMCERAFELMCARAVGRETFGKRLARHGMVQEKVALSRIEIDQCRLLVLQAAKAIDVQGNKAARKHVAMAKVAVARTAQRVLDRAIQVFGGAGLSSDFPLAYMFTGARALRIADGPDEVHMLSIASLELKAAAKRAFTSKL
ncbi:serine/threonine protein kinase [Salpingoeca rosetta]|uniref:Acyl-CoA dehydrogenase family member 11 n=1 Tax=Salpingoeca rosetta (strain ATCC 50818 / BSB-021) TaxID=946362 RepID=F2UPH7_SALR5|nr:serine/threonine protein kinase [Salpingoeca rosetta]EGD79532.1 serine/threonine protein kinase [Salpingoeca rosetta]|eukprot:XP_004989013.1 serine/threonine protein kinase [Salpingoeca rosetta]